MNRDNLKSLVVPAMLLIAGVIYFLKEGLTWPTVALLISSLGIFLLVGEYLYKEWKAHRDWVRRNINKKDDDRR